MTDKSDILNYNQTECFELGREIRAKGHSIHYDPFRNLSADELIERPELVQAQEAFEAGWNS